MLQPSSAFLLATSLLTALPANADGLYTKKSPVLQVNQKNYDQLIADSNYTSNLKPAYEKAAKSLDGLAKVAAVNCDDDENKSFCGRMGVQGFPTIKIMTPSKKPGKPRVEDYQGARSAKAIVNAVTDKIPNHVKKVTDKDLESWLSEDEEAPKAILFTEKGTTSPLIRAIAIDFLGSVKVAQIRNKEANAVEKFGIDKFPSLILLPGGKKEPIVYDGELKKKPLVEFIGQVADPNPDPAPVKSGAKASKASKSSKAQTEKTKPTESPDSKVVPDDGPQEGSKPSQAPTQAAAIDTLSTGESLESACLTSKSGTCVLVLLPVSTETEAKTDLPISAKEALNSLSEVAHRHSLRQSKLFPFYSVPAANSGANTLRTELELSDKSVEVIALNGRRGWWRRYDPSESANYDLARVEAWIDAIKLGEGSRSKLPDGIVKDEADEQAAEHDEL
ncbi:hypothetical protein EYZ11_004284 [Aspergillus tanneri]|uniref:protein disulfide-isomerase n=1 Tax=Aspergillus tanneri TaxID=1220188 RepID=A0A4S3JLI9_9EURO|nr:hypothetical protein EYZ11_004284 [Aspergillus tanneri]